MYQDEQIEDQVQWWIWIVQDFIFFSPHLLLLLFYHVVSILYYMALNDRMPAELERIWKLERLRNTMETLSQYIRCPDQAWNQAASKYKLPHLHSS
jgi:hypothetical protein